ncbi:MAG: hypothetical protein ACK55Z_18830, partial [bacterium]
SYTYCYSTNKCVADVWNYINQWCPSIYIPGWMLDVNTDCEAPIMTGACPNFVSDPSKYGVNDTRKTNLTLN